MSCDSPGFIDTHIHLDAAEFSADLDGVIASAVAVGVQRFVIPAVERKNFDAVRALAARIPGAVYAQGIHPLYIDGALDADLEVLQAALNADGACAVGEIGLDAYPGHPDLAKQEAFFVAQLKLAQKFDLPVILHVRRAQDRVLKYLRRHRVRGGIAHAFNGSLQQAQAFIDLGFKLGFGGAMTYSGSLRIRELAQRLPLEAMVLESDAPDIPPAWAPRSRNEPANVARFAQVLAQLRGVDPQQIQAATNANAAQVLPALLS